MQNEAMIKKLIAQLADLQPILSASLLHQGLVKDWIKSMEKPSLIKMAKQTFSSFETDFKACLKAIDDTNRLENENSIRNQFHLALVGVPVIEVEIKQKLQRIGSGMPKPSLLNLSSPVDKQVKNYVSKPPKHLEKARKPMEELLE